MTRKQNAILAIAFIVAALVTIAGGAMGGIGSSQARNDLFIGAGVLVGVGFLICMVAFAFIVMKNGKCL